MLGLVRQYPESENGIRSESRNFDKQRQCNIFDYRKDCPGIIIPPEQEYTIQPLGAG